MKKYNGVLVRQAVIKVTESTITNDNGGWGSGGFSEGELVVIPLRNSQTLNLTVGSEYEWTESHSEEGVYGYVESLNKGIVVFID